MEVVVSLQVGVWGTLTRHGLDRLECVSGSGRSATVFKATALSTGDVVAIKVFPRNKYDPYPHAQERAMYELVHSASSATASQRRCVWLRLLVV